MWPYRIATVRYARGIAYAITGDVVSARQEMALFTDASSKVPITYTLHNNTCVDMLTVAAAMLSGEIEYRAGERTKLLLLQSQIYRKCHFNAGNMKAAFSKLREAVSRSDNLNYDEPWGWMQPPRHALGALLLEQVISNSG